VSFQRLYRIGLTLALILALSLLLAQALVRFDPYRLAQVPMAWSLTRNPGLPDRLVLYSSEAAAWRETFRLGVDLAQGIVTVVERLETLGWWEGLLEWVDRIPGALPFFRSIVDLARDFIALDAALGDLSEAARRRILTSKRCSNDNLQSLGYEFEFPTYREGYRAAVEAYCEAH